MSRSTLLRSGIAVPTAAVALVLGIAGAGAAPSNDAFTAAQSLPGSTGTVTGSNVDATRETGEGVPDPNVSGKTVWYTWQAPFTGPASVDTRGSDFDTFVAVYTGTRVDRLTWVAGNDIDFWVGHARAQWTAVAGTTYRIQVDGMRGQSGSISLTWNRPRPPNDDFAAAQELTGSSGSVTGSNLLATSESGEPTDFGQGHSIWYRWTAPATTDVELDATGTEFPAYVVAYTGSSVSALTWQASNPDSSQPRLRFRATAGTTYRIELDSAGFQNTGPTRLSWRTLASPPNDAFAAAQRLDSRPSTVAGDVWGATAEPGEPAHAGGAAKYSVWYRWRAPATLYASVQISENQFHCGTAVYTGDALGALTPVAGHRNYHDCSVGFAAKAGVDYAIALNAETESGGPFSLRLYYPGPGNDAFTAARTVYGASVETGHNALATKEPGEPEHGTRPGGASVWFTWGGSTAGTVTVETVGSTFDTLLAAYAGTNVGGLTLLARDDDGAGGGASRISFHVDGSASVRVAVDGVAGAVGDVKTTWSVRPDPPTNDAFAAAQRVSLEEGWVRGRTTEATKEPGEPDHAGNTGGRSVWYRWTAPADGLAILDTYDVDTSGPSWAPDTDFDTLLAVYRGTSLGSLTTVAANDDHSSIFGLSRVRFPVTAGEEFVIAVDGKNGRSGRFALNWTVAPPNDDFDLAAILSGEAGTVLGTTFRSTWEEDPSERLDPADVWYLWRAPQSGKVAFTLEASSTYAGFAVWKGPTLWSAEAVATTYVEDGRTVTRKWEAEAGTVYRIEVYGDAFGAFSLTWGPTTIPPPAVTPRPTNDDFAAASLLVGETGTVTGTNEGATVEDDEPVHSDDDYGWSSVWYRWTAPFTGTLELDPTGSDFTTILSVFGGDRLDRLLRVNYGCCATTVTRFGVTVGTTYFIAVSGDSSWDPAGKVTLSWRRAASAPANDNLAAAAPLPGAAGSLDLSTAGASPELGEPYHAALRPVSSLWYTWTAPANGPVSFSTSATSVEGRLAVYTGSSYTSLTRIAANDESVAGGTEARVVFTASAGTTYRIAFDAWTAGSASLSWRQPPTPPNDAFANAAPLPLAWAAINRYLVTDADTFGATTEAGEPVHAGVAGAAATVWYRLPWDWGTTPLVVDTVGSSFDTVLAVYTGSSLGTLTPLAADDDSAGGGLSRLAFTATGTYSAAKTYWIAVAGKNGATGKLALTVAPPEQPPNDHFHAATWLTGASGAVTGTVLRASLQNGEPSISGFGGGDGSIWYRWTAPTTGTWRFDITGTEFDAKFGVFVGDHVGGLLELAGTGDAVLFVPVTAGETYSIAISGDSRSTGPAKLAWRPATVGANDAFAQAQTLTGSSGSVIASNREASVEPAEPFHADSEGGASLWYRWTAPSDGTVAIDTAGSAPADNVLAVYTGSTLLQLEEVAANDDFGGEVVPSVRFAAVAGTTYSIAVDTVGPVWPPGADRGDVKLNWLHAAPPPNDRFAAAQSLLGDAGSVTGSTLGARTEPGEPEHGERAAGASVWYAWTAPAHGTYRFGTGGSGFAALLGIYEGGAVDALRVVRRSDDLGGRADAVAFAATAGTTYRIAIDGLVRATGSVSLSWTRIAPPNDAFGAAQEVTGRLATVTGSTRGATREGGEPVHAGRAGTASIWYRWRAPATEPVVFDTVGSDFDTTLGVYTGTAVSSLAPVAASDDAGGLHTSAATFEAREGVVYRIAVDGGNGQTGNVVLDWAPAPLPRNDDLADAQTIGGREGQVTATSFPATHEAGEPDHAAAGTRRSVWYRYKAPATGRVVFRTDWIEFDTVLAAYTGSSPSSLTQLAADGGTDGTYGYYRRARVAFDVTAGAEYAVAVDGRTGGGGVFTLLWSLAPANDALAAAAPIGGASGSVEGTTEGAGMDPAEAEAGILRTHTVWYRWTAPADGTFLFDLAGSEVEDASVEIFDGADFGSLRAGGHWRDPGRLGVVGGSSYLVRVASRSPGRFRLNWRPVDAPANDNLAAARTLSGDRGVTSGTNVGSSREPGEPYHGEQGYTVWFRWTAPASGKLSAWTSGTSYDSQAVAYTGTAVGALTKVEGFHQTTCGPCHSYFTVPVTGGTTYRIALDGVAQGSYVLNWSFDGASPASGTSNDAFAAAHVLTGADGLASGSNVGATKEPGEPNHAGKAGGKSVWYSWRAPASGSALVETNGCTLDTLIGVYTGSNVGSLTAVASNDDIGPACAGSRVTFTATAGVVYRIALDGDGGVAGDFLLRWTGRPADTIAPSTRITAGPAGTVSGSDASFSFTAEAGASFQCSLDGAAFEACSSPHSYSVLAAGTHVFRVRATDTAGNVEQPPAERAWTIAPQPANDAFAARTAVTGLTGEALGTVTGATKEAGEPNHADRTNDRSVWFRWTAPRDGLATIAIGQSSIWETHVGVYTGTTLGSLVPVGRIAANPWEPPPTGSITFRAVKDTTYAIAVAGLTNGDFRLDWRLAPANDDRRDAITLVGGSGSWSGDNVAASQETGEPAHAGRVGGRSIWFRWTAPATGTLQLDTLGSETGLDTLLAVYTEGPPGFWWEEPLYPRASDDDSAGGGKSLVRLEVFTGTTYWIAVDGFQADTGAVTLNRSFDTAVSPTPPTVALTAPADGALVRADVPLAASATDADGIERVEFLVNGSVVGVDTVAPYAMSWDSTTVGDGPATVTARASDFSSAIASSATRTITVDNTDPETRIDSGPSGVTTATTATFAFSSNDAGVSFTCALDGLWQPCTSPRAYTGLTPGRHSFQVAATDRAGNVDLDPELREWEVTATDVTPPETTIVSGPSGTTTSRTATFEFTSEPGATFECRLDSAPFTPCTSPRSYSDLALGAHTFYVRARDGAGNVGPEATRTWTVEATPPPPGPETTIDSAVTNGRDATFSFSSPAAGATFECALDESAFAACTSPRSYTALTFGQHTFRVRAVASGVPDSTPATHQWTVVEPPPVNDDFAAAETLAGASGVHVVDNVNASSEPGEPLHAGEIGGASIWFAWTAPADGTATFDTIGSDLGLDTLLAVYTGFALGSLTPVASDDDGGWNGKSRLVFRARGGVTYLIAVDGYLGDEGNVELAWSLVDTPANDDFAAARVVEGYSGGVQATNVGATKQAGEPQHGADPGGASVWFRWTAPASGMATIDTAGSGFDTLVAVYTGGSLGALSLVAENDDASVGVATSSVSFAAVGGTTYSIAVDGFYEGPHGALTGPVSLAWSLPDTTPPAVTLTSPAAGATVRGTVQLAATASDTGGVRRVEFLAGDTLVGGDETAPYAVGWSSAGDGPVTLTARAMDNAGNVATSSAAVTVDNTAPQTSIDSGPSGSTSANEATFTFSSEAGATFACRLDGGDWSACTPPRSYSGLAAGGHTFAVRATDAAGNVDLTPAERSWTILGPDTTAPQVTIDSGPESTTTSRSASFAFGSNEPGSTFECALDDGTVAPCSSPAAYADLAVGAHEFRVRARDTAGNMSSTAVWRWNVVQPSATAPETTIDSGPSGTVDATTATFTFSSDQADASFECSLDGGPYAACTSPATRGPLAAGQHTFAVRAVIAAGTDASPATRTWTIAAPTAPAPPPSGGGGGGSADLVVSLAASAATAGVGDSVEVTITVTNRAALAQGVDVTVTLPATVSVVGTTADRGSGCAGTAPIVCNLDFLGPPGTIRLFLRVTGPGPITVAALARAQQADANLADNDATLTIQAPAASVPAPPPPATVFRPPTVTIRNGTARAETIRGTSGRDLLRGYGGPDRLYGLGGNDTLVGGTGADSLHGGAGNDTITARDRARDTITCGSGRDVVQADPGDRVARDCERVVRRRR